MWELFLLHLSSTYISKIKNGITLFLARYSFINEIDMREKNNELTWISGDGVNATAKDIKQILAQSI